ncbi:MAG: hypothetical protein ACKO96_24250, partial [Flammeovirgaceae bacterium]
SLMSIPILQVWTASLVAFSSATLSYKQFTVNFLFALTTDHNILAITSFVEPVGTFEAVNKGLFIFSLYSALVAPILDKFI